MAFHVQWFNLTQSTFPESLQCSRYWSGHRPYWKYVLYLFFVRRWPTPYKLAYSHHGDNENRASRWARASCLLSSAQVQFPSSTFFRWCKWCNYKILLFPSKWDERCFINAVRRSSHDVVSWIYFQLEAGCFWLAGSSSTCHIQGPQAPSMCGSSVPSGLWWPAARRMRQGHGMTSTALAACPIVDPFSHTKYQQLYFVTLLV